MTTLSIESIASSSTSPTIAGDVTRCASCGTPLAADQRYCLQCGERAAPISSFLLGATPSAATPAATGPTPSSPPSQPPRIPAANGGAQHGNTLLVIAGVGVLMLAMGVGVLIGRSGQAKQAPAPAPEVITVAGSGSGVANAPSEATFTSDWPSATNGYTVQLQTLTQTATVSAVQAAKSAATAKGAKSVGALNTEEFSSLTAGSYLIYSGVDHKKSEAEKALGTLRKSFPAAKVISVSNRGASSKSAGGSSGGSGSTGAGSTPTNPAPAKVLEGLNSAKGKNYEEKSKNLPNVVETG